MFKVFIYILLLFFGQNVLAQKTKKNSQKALAARKMASRMQELEKQKVEKEKARRELIRRKRKAIISGKNRKFGQ